MHKEILHANVFCKETDELISTIHAETEQELINYFVQHFGEYYCYLVFFDVKDFH